MAPLKPLRLRCSVQNYDWGRIGEESKVSRLFSSNSQSEIDPRKPYAELWMGTHPSGPSFVVGSGIDGSDCDLKSWVDENHGAVGEKVVEKWGRDLPFLFKSQGYKKSIPLNVTDPYRATPHSSFPSKYSRHLGFDSKRVLSVAKALSIQAHPDKELARVLNKMHPSIYKDSNHKPEMAVALTEFEALCGFVSLEELKGVLNSVPEIVELVGHVEAGQVMNIKENDGEEKVKAVLKSIFTQLMSASKDAVSGMVSKMRNRLNIENKVRALTEKEQLALRLEKQYPADVGVLSSFFFNYVKLKPGEALYLGANEPHAYLYGECIECMATSDNVVRAGLTPKFRDVQTLCSMLTYKQGFPEILRGIPLNPYVKRYMPPYDEFEVDRCCLPSGVSVVFPAVPGPSIFIVMAGDGSMHTDSTEDNITEGDVFFVPAKTMISITAAFVGDDNVNAFGSLELYRAGVNSRCLE